jgi:hypothetical protein
MTRRGVSQLLLLLLGVVAVAFVFRSCLGTSESSGFVDFGEGWSEDRLRHEAFRLERPVRLAVSATGSFETDSALAAFGWIVRRDDRAVVWQMTPANAVRERGTLAVASDTITLEAGTYDAYFATFGDPLLPVQEAESVGEWMAGLLRFGNRPWESDKSKWAFRIDPVDAADESFAHRLTDRDERDATPTGDGLVWAGGPAGSRSEYAHDYQDVRGVASRALRDDHLSHTFVVSDPTTLRIESIGELYRGPTDYGWIDNLTTGERVWEMTLDNTEPAGGSVKNRRFSGTLDLAPAIYRATFETDRSHDADHWTANPPLDPTAYGLYLYSDTPDRIAAFDPWSDLPRLVEMTGVGDSALETATFTLDDSLRVWIYALGEMRSGSDYDHAWLIRDGNGTIWKMDYDETRHAGGEARNRVQESSLFLPPGTYTLHFESDDSHSPARWRGELPEYPERWGVTLFALGGEAPTVEVTRTSEREREWEDRGPTPPRSQDGTLPVRLAPLRNSEDVERTFTLDEETRLRIYAVGEILLTDRYDYGWIIDNEASDLVWEMTRSNTEPAGGSRKNREFDDTISLPAGTYTVHFQTDGSHAFGDFSQGSPSDPNAWGIVVERAEAPPAPPAPPSPPDSVAAPDSVTAPPANTATVEA